MDYDFKVEEFFLQLATKGANALTQRCSVGSNQQGWQRFDDNVFFKDEGQNRSVQRLMSHSRKQLHQHRERQLGHGLIMGPDDLKDNFEITEGAVH